MAPESSSLLSGLRNERAHVTGFADMVHDVLERFERHTGTQIMLVVDDSWPSQMVGRTARHLLRIVEEALQIVRHHSSARSVKITLERVGDDAVVTVQDDGRGLHDLPEGQGHDITNTLLTAVPAGWGFTIETSRDRGITTKVSVPLQASPWTVIA